MPMTTSDDGVALHWEEAGEGPPILFVHEFGGDHRSWAPQMKYFSSRYRCLTYAARGYPPSESPTDPAAYSQDRAVADALAVLDAAGVDAAHIIGNSMGGSCAVHLGMVHPERAISLVVAGCGSGAEPSTTDAFRADALAMSQAFVDQGAAAVAQEYGTRPSRMWLHHKDPAAHAEHLQILAEHDDLGASLTMRGVQAGRASLYSEQEELAGMTVPTLLLVGDADDPAFAPTLMLRRTLPNAGLAVLPLSGHLTNLEEPDLFHQLVDRFHEQVAAGKWVGTPS